MPSHAVLDTPPQAASVDDAATATLSAGMVRA
jgi:hypothetical protein